MSLVHIFSNSSAALVSSSALSVRRESFSPRSAKPALRPSRSPAAAADDADVAAAAVSYTHLTLPTKRIV